MSSAVKTLALLDFFSATRPEIGLSQLCRLARRDKATTYRHLQALEETGFVEQNPLTKGYRLGPAILQLAQTRETTVPRKVAAEPALAILADATGETSHVSVLSGQAVYALASCESPKHSTRVIIDVPKLPLHATAAGICALAFGPADLMEVATANMEIFNTHTARTAAELADMVETARQTGFGYSDRCFENDVQSLAAPVFDQTGLLAGTVSVASVATRFTDDLERGIREQLKIASRDISRSWGGTLPESIEALWAVPLSQSQPLEAAS